MPWLVAYWLVVADWLQAEIGYTLLPGSPQALAVADWLQAEIGYTPTPPRRNGRRLRIGCRLRLVTLDPNNSSTTLEVADWLQAEIGYTGGSTLEGGTRVADWLQAEIGYTYRAALKNE